MCAFFPLDSHFMAYFITWKIRAFSHHISITWGKTAKPTEWGKPGKLLPSNILQNLINVENLENFYSYFPIVYRVYSIRFPSYGIIHHIGNAWVFSSNFP